MFGRKKREERALSRARLRAQRLSARELQHWADSTVYAIGRSLSESRKTSDLQEVEYWLKNAQTETNILSELISEERERLSESGPR